MIDYDRKFDDDVVEFFNTIEHLGGGSTVNFIRGPMYHEQRRRKKYRECCIQPRGFHLKQRATKGKEDILQEMAI